MVAADSTRFIIQMIMNVYICNFAKKKLAKMTTKKEGKKAFKSYITFLLFVIVLIGLNQTLYFFFKPKNLYEELEIPRSMSPDEITAYQKDLQVKIISMDNIPYQQRIAHIKKLQAMVQVLTHPARRLSYDTFGQTDTAYAWAFKSHYFLLSTIIGSSIFYILCTFMNLMNEGKGEVKQSFKLQIMVMIVLFLWEVQLIMKTQTRMHQHTDSLDMVYTAFPVHQRRQMIKIILIPCMNVIKFFFRFFVTSPSEKKFLKIAKNPEMMKMTAKVHEIVSKVQIDEHLEDRVQVALSEARKVEPLHTDIYRSQRKALQNMLFCEGDNLLLDDEIAMLLRYFMIK